MQLQFIEKYNLRLFTNLMIPASSLPASPRLCNIVIVVVLRRVLKSRKPKVFCDDLLLPTDVGNNNVVNFLL